jgi:hypothetical protein
MRIVVRARRWSLCVVTCLGCAGLYARTASAIEPEVTSDSSFQAYDMRSPTGQTVLERTRFTSMLGTSLYDILGEGSSLRDGPDLSFRARVRYDADYGISGPETDPTNNASFVPGLTDNGGNSVDLMYAYLEGRRFLHGVLGFKIGRQYMTDSLGWWSFDGADVKATLPFYVAVEGYGGLEVRGGMPLSTSRFEAGGVWRGDRSGFDPSLYPQFQPADVAPAFGAAIESAGVTWIHSRLTYRRVYDTGSVGTTEFASGLNPPNTYDGTRISTDKIGYAVEVDLKKWGAIKGGFNYDLYDARFGQIFGSLDAYATKKVTVSVDYDYYSPTFDGDSIWNFFAGEPMNDISLRANVDATKKFSVSAAANARIYSVQTSADNPYQSPNPNPGATYYPSNGHPFDEGGNIAARYKWGEGSLGFRGAVDVGDAGDRVGADVNGQRILETRILLRARLGLWQWDDKLRPDRDATNFGYMLGVGYRFAPRCQTVLEWQEDVNRLVGQRFRALLTLSLALGR